MKKAFHGTELNLYTGEGDQNSPLNKLVPTSLHKRKEFPTALKTLAVVIH